MNINNAILGIIIVGLVVVAIVFFLQPSNPIIFNTPVLTSPTPTDVLESPVPTTSSENTISVTLSPILENSIQQEGVAVLSAIGNTTKVTIVVNSVIGLDNPQPAHIHEGNCPGVGNIVYPLNSIVNGKSETILSTTLDRIKTQGALAINVHKSDKETSIYTTCGQINQ
jgi:hypothetical protein